MYGYIYLTTNLINNKKYIGQKKSSKFLGNKYLGSGKILGTAINKYGTNNFHVELIEECNSKEELNEREEYWISFHNAKIDRNYYNICKGGEAGPGGPRFKGHKHSEETKKLMSESRKGIKNSNFGNHRKMSKEERQKHSDAVLGNKNPMYGRSHKDSTKEKLSQKASNLRWVSNDKESIRIHLEDLDKYLSNGYIRGRKLKCSSTTIEI